MSPDYSKAALNSFLDTAGTQGLLNQNTLGGWRAAVGRILEDVADDLDVRTIDVPTAIKRYHNKNPGVLKGNSLKEYERRLTRALGDFVIFMDDPTKYAGRGRGPSDESNAGGKEKPAKRRSQTTVQKQSSQQGSRSIDAGVAKTISAILGLSYDYPIRPDFLASVVVPRDMNAHEARRLCGFIMTLATDYMPKVDF